MPITPRERLARVLDGSQPPGAFSAQLSVPARDVRLTVAGAGPVSFPVRAPQARRMIACARPARFGRGEQTLMDLGVRDTWEITPDQVTLTGLDWDAILAEVRDGLGLPSRARLRAEPHALLVYGKGQFFLPHQDSEKDDTMIGSWWCRCRRRTPAGNCSSSTAARPSRTRRPRARCRWPPSTPTAGTRSNRSGPGTGSRLPATCCWTAIRPARFRLSRQPRPRGTSLSTSPPGSPGGKATAGNRRTGWSTCWTTSTPGAPLSWDRLKGADAERAALLRAAAEDAGCEAVLALTEIKQTWDTEPGRRGRGADLTYIITSELTLSWWAGVPGGEPISLYVPDEQVCASTPSADLKPYDSEYTGYMGNYGNTMDRWYRRAAVVVWPGQHAFAARAEASPSWALTELSARLDAGDLAGVRAAAESVAPFWKAPGPGLLEPALRTAAGLADPGIALMLLLRPFAVEWVTPAHAGGLAALAARYGESWHRNLLEAWFGSRNTWQYTGDVDRKGWAGALPGLTAALRDAGAAAAAGWLLAASWGWLDDGIRLWLRYPSPATRRKQLAELGKPLAGLLAAAGGTALAGEIVAVLREHGDDGLACLLPMLRAAGPGPSAP